jgi:cell division protein FtsI (penicillin-binding protein 3)
MKKDKTLIRRIYFLIVVMGLWGAAIGIRLYFLHVVHSADYKIRAERQQQRTLDVSPRRGTIYDRNGNELAVSIKVDSVFAVPEAIGDPAAAARKLSSLTGVPYKELLEKLDSERTFVWIKRKLSAAESAAIQKENIAGVYFQKEDQRFYPKRHLAAHVLGYVNIDEEGMGGLEYRYNESVKGDSGRVVIVTDARGRRFQSMQQPATPGANLVTTIDENIQYVIEKELQAAAASTRAKAISIVAMDPRSGEILGMASHPTFNPNEYRRYSPTSWINRAVSHLYEPGSTFKIATTAAALEEKLTTPDELIDCQMGSIVLHGHRIGDSHPYGLISVREIMQNSSNVGTIKLGLRVGDERFASYIHRLGFGRPTNIDLPGEERGITKPASRWSKISIGAISIGQEIAVTPLQVLSMISVVANGGIRYRPHVVKRVEHPQEGVISQTEPQGERVISELTARQLQDMLEVVVTDGTARHSQLEGYRAAGKTGTAQKVDEKTGRYAANKYVASFAGYAPASNPSLALIVVIDEPSGAYYGAQVAAPVFKRIAEQVLRYRSAPPDAPSYAPQYTLKDEPAPQPARAVYERPQSFIEVSSPAAEFGDVAVPDFFGKSLREVTEEALKTGLRLQSIGSGAAVAQAPPPGAAVRAGSRVQVRFSSRVEGR